MSSNLKINFVSFFPTEISQYIFSFMSSKDIAVCGQVSKDWKTIVDDESLWKKLQNSWQLPFIDSNKPCREQMIAQLKNRVFVADRKGFFQAILKIFGNAQVDKITAVACLSGDKKEYCFLCLKSAKSELHLDEDIAFMDVKKIEEYFLKADTKKFIMMKEGELTSDMVLMRGQSFAKTKGFASKEVFLQLYAPSHQVNGLFSRVLNMEFKTEDFPYELRADKKKRKFDDV